MIASVSITAREYFGGRWGLRRSRNRVYSGRARKRQPLATLMSSTLRPSQSAASSVRILRSTSLPRSSSNSFLRSLSCNGSALVSSAASSTRFTSCKSNDGESMGGGFDVNRCIGLLLRDFNQRFARKLEDREESHHELRHAFLRREELREFDQLRFLQPAQDRAHVLAHRKLVARNAVMLVHVRA